MNILDLIIGVILIFFAISGLKKGIIHETFYLASFIIGIYGALYFSGLVADWLATIINIGKEYISIVAFIITFLLFVFAIRLLGQAIGGIIEAINLGFIDKIGGALFGILKGALILSIIIMIFNVLGITGFIDKNVRNSSPLYTYTEQIANVLYKNQDVVKNSINKGFDKIEDVIETSLTK